MTHRAQRLADALGEAYKQAHPQASPDPAPTADEVEATAVEWFRQRIYGTPRTEEESS